MLSYRHAYHAGNAGDVLKHAVLAVTLGELCRKDKPIGYLETHAGAGLYDLAADRARRTGESEAGIGRLWLRSDVPAGLQPYLDAVHALNPDGLLRRYPGSPLVAAHLLRPSDRLVLMELHPQDHAALRAALRADRRVHVHRRDGYEGLVALTPPAERRGLALLDPSDEVASDYADVAECVADVHRRWPNGCLAIWYPLLPGDPFRRTERALARVGIPGVLRVELAAADGAALGMRGSGLLLANPPWKLRDTLGSMLPWLAGVLGGGRAAYRLDWLSVP
jgi:23S rRNA (adenine2030-N6)-methyltransferase